MGFYQQVYLVRQHFKRLKAGDFILCFRELVFWCQYLLVFGQASCLEKVHLLGFQGVLRILLAPP